MYNQLSRHKQRERERGGGRLRETPSGSVSQLYDIMQGKSTDGCEWERCASLSVYTVHHKQNLTHWMTILIRFRSGLSTQAQ